MFLVYVIMALVAIFAIIKLATWILKINAKAEAEIIKFSERFKRDHPGWSLSQSSININYKKLINHIYTSGDYSLNNMDNFLKSNQCIWGFTMKMEINLDDANKIIK